MKEIDNDKLFWKEVTDSGEWDAIQPSCNNDLSPSCIHIQEDQIVKGKVDKKLARNVPHDPTPLPPPPPNDDDNMDFHKPPSSPHPDLFDPSLQAVL